MAASPCCFLSGAFLNALLALTIGPVSILVLLVPLAVVWGLVRTE